MTYSLLFLTNSLRFWKWTSGLQGGVQHILPHIRALREMLRQRGGTSKLGMGGYTAKIIMM